MSASDKRRSFVTAKNSKPGILAREAAKAPKPVEKPKPAPKPKVSKDE